MINKNLLITAMLSLSLVCCAEPQNNDQQTGELIKPNGEDVESGERDPLLQPFDSKSVWNMPIGTDAEYLHAGLVVPKNSMLTVDEDYIFMTPDEPLVDVYHSDGEWGADERRRCVRSDKNHVLARLPLPKDFIVSPETWDGRVPNAGVAVLLKDKRYIYQGQPYAHCTEDGDFTLSYNMNFDENEPGGYVDIYGDGRVGGHGGSGLSSLGGTLRAHELTKSSGAIKHALKMNVYAAINLYYDFDTQCGYRWPARSNDGYAGNGQVGLGYGSSRPSDILAVKQCVMGALMALKPDFDIAKLRTEPAKILAQAFIDYGAYIVDDTAWDVYAIITEWGPAGRFKDEFKKNWGFDFDPGSKGSGTNYAEWNDWALDIKDIYTNLHIITNNSAQNPGGPGKRRVPMAAPLMKIK